MDFLCALCVSVVNFVRRPIFDMFYRGCVNGCKYGCLAALVLFLGACAPAYADVRVIPTRFRTPTPRPMVWPTVAIPDPTATPIPTAIPRCWPEQLPEGLHISASGSYTETENQAVGPMVCRIQRDSCAYYYLVGDLDPEILFARSEAPPYDEEDILMHPDMIMPLTTLRDLVAAEWNGEVRLLVTDAYDSLLEHHLAQADFSRRYSQHFEGRSIDLVTYPVNRALYPRLCALARCAGFDWVHNEGNHCHASINAPSLCLKCKD